MKPAPFEYQAPATLREAIDLLTSDPEATVIAGGQSLMPVLAFRLAAPSMLVDLRRIPGTCRPRACLSVPRSLSPRAFTSCGARPCAAARRSLRHSERSPTWRVAKSSADRDASLTLRWREPDSNLYGAFPVKGLFLSRGLFWFC